MVLIESALPPVIPKGDPPSTSMSTSDRPLPSHLIYPSPAETDPMLPPTPSDPTSGLEAQQSTTSPTTIVNASPRHPLSHTITLHSKLAHPPMHRSDSMPQGYTPRPGMIRTLTTPALAAMGSPSGLGKEFKLNSPVGSAKIGESSRKIEEDREDLTTKGKKRKRLAKACSACHKNKRRCDGFAPCSNCEFSSRACMYLNSAGEIIPPPRTRETTAVRKDSSAVGTPTTSSVHIGVVSTSNGAAPGGKGDRPIAGGNASSNGSPEKRPYNNQTGRSGKGGQGLDQDGRDEEDEYSGSIHDPLEAVDRDTALSAELIDLFFSRIHPYGSMLHGPTFHYRLFVGRASPLLLDAMYALSAHLSQNPTLLNTISPSIPLWARGNVFADRASRTAKHLINLRATWSDEEKRLDRGTWEETEFVQALYLLSVYYVSARQPTLGFFFLDAAIDILRPTSTATLPRPSTLAGLSTIEYLTLGECRNRTFWMLVLHDLCAAANGRPRRLMDHEVYNIPLPGDEGQWERWGGGGSLARDGARRDGLAVGTGNWGGSEGQIGELGHVLRVLVVFSDIMTVANSGIQSPEARGTPGQHEHALKSWAHALPSSMRFDENTLTAAVAKLNSSQQTVSRSGWLFAYMHAMAECGMFYLQAALATIGAEYTAQRQSQAVDNIAVILEAIGARGRESPLMVFPLLVVSNWHDHLRSTPAPPTAQQHLLDDRIPLWWAEASRDWGFERNPPQAEPTYSRSHLIPPSSHPERHSFSERSPISSHAPPSSTLSTTSSLSHRHSHSYSKSQSSRPGESAISRPSPLPPTSTSSLGLYGTSPPIAPVTSVSSRSAEAAPSSQVTLVAHSASSSSSGAAHRYSQPQLAPLRQRANTLASTSVTSHRARSPSPGFPGHLTLSTSGGSLLPSSVQGGRRPLPSISGEVPQRGSISGDRLEIKLPPLPPMDPSPRHEGVFKFPSFWNNATGNNGGSGSGTPTGLTLGGPLGDANGAGVGKTKFSSPSPRFNPYSSSGKRSSIGGPGGMGRFGQEDKVDSRPVSPKSIPRTLLPERREEEANGKSATERGEERDVGGPVGIQALISAAEEKSKERETIRGLEVAA